MHTKKNKIQIREGRIDEALTESFPASDPPFYVGGGMLQPNDNQGDAKDVGDHEQLPNKRPT